MSSSNNNNNNPTEFELQVLPSNNNIYNNSINNNQRHIRLFDEENNNNNNNNTNNDEDDNGLGGGGNDGQRREGEGGERLTLEEWKKKQRKVIVTLAAVGALLLVLGLMVALAWPRTTNNDNPNQDTTFGVCSELGLKYPDSPSVCSCFDGTTGQNCEQEEEEEEEEEDVNLSVGEPQLLQQYWITHALSFGSSLSLLPDYRPLYEEKVDLEELIRQLHDKAGNAETVGKRIVIGHGATQLLNAALYAIRGRVRHQLSIYAQSPHHYQYQDIVESSFGDLEWAEKAEEADVEIVTCPNSPDNVMRLGKTKNTPYLIHDMAYMWPSFYGFNDSDYLSSSSSYGHQNQKMNESLMIFTNSYLSGHPALRFGWALVEDERIADIMLRYVQLTTQEVGSYQRFYAHQLFTHILSSLPTTTNSSSTTTTTRPSFFSWIWQKLSWRWSEVNRVLGQPEKEEQLPRFTLLSNTTDNPPGAYLWLRCNNPDDIQVGCTSALLSATKILGRDGMVFFVESQKTDTGDTRLVNAEKGKPFVRLNLLCYDHLFNRFINALQQLISPSPSSLPSTTTTPPTPTLSKTPKLSKSKTPKP